MLALGFAFFVTAALYAAVGFGGGSTYNALLVLADTDYRMVPLVALACNIVVVSGNIIQFSRAGHVQMRRILPWAVFSVPASFAGGLIPVAEVYFIALLACALLASGVRLLWPARLRPAPPEAPPPRWVAPLLGSVLGLVAGITGIGGGIFLAPVLYMMRWGDSRAIAAACSVFILVNSLAGLAGQVAKQGAAQGAVLLSMLAPYVVLVAAVACGGQIGAWLGAGRISAQAIKKMTGVLVLYVAFRLLARLAGGV